MEGSDSTLGGAEEYQKQVPHDYVTNALQSRSDVAHPPTLIGLPADPVDGKEVMWLDDAGSLQVEFDAGDIVRADAQVDPSTPPFVGLRATRVELKPEAVVTFVRRVRTVASDFDADARHRELGTVLPRGGFGGSEACWGTVAWYCHR